MVEAAEGVHATPVALPMLAHSVHSTPSVHTARTLYLVHNSRSAYKSYGSKIQVTYTQGFV